MTRVPIGIVAHHARQERAEKLAEHLDADVVAVDTDGSLGAGANHEVCYRWLAGYDTPWAVILEDDAVPVREFRTQLNAVLAAAPPTGLLSLYLGRFRPPHWQPSIARVISGDENFLISSELLHHVAVAIRTPLIPPLLQHLRGNDAYRKKKMAIDEAVGAFARALDMPVVYCHPSIVNHDTRLDTVIDRHVSRHATDDGSRPRTELRQAWAFGTRDSWRTTTTMIPDPVG